MCDQTIKQRHMHSAGTIQVRDLFHSAQARKPVQEQLKSGENSTKYDTPVIICIHVYVY